jgi:hypothetical protein
MQCYERAFNLCKRKLIYCPYRFTLIGNNSILEKDMYLCPFAVALVMLRWGDCVTVNSWPQQVRCNTWPFP